MQRFGQALFILGLAISALLLGSCTSVGAIRTVAAPTDILPVQKTSDLLALCSPGTGRGNTGGELFNSIEDYGKYTIGFAEYSDQGWEYNAGVQRKALIKKLDTDMRKPEVANATLVNVVFIHGWHHSAHDDDCNVNEFRAMIHQLNADFQQTSSAPNATDAPMQFRFNGVYVAWRGDSLTLPALRHATVFDRRVAAEHVAKGAVRELFADLRHLELDDEETHSSARHPKGRVRTIVIGHSFGGLIAFHSLSPGFINDLSLSRQLESDVQTVAGCSKAAASRRFWPDMTILINPAFEASRFQAVSDVARTALPCKDENPRPKMVVVTADNDIPTGKIYPVFRTIASIFEQYDATSDVSEGLEREANIHVIGFVKRFQSHRLALEKIGTSTCVRESRIFFTLNDPAAVAALTARLPPSQRSAQPLIDAQREAVLAANSAQHVWVVGVPPEIVNGHDGFLYPNASAGKYDPYLLHWLVGVYLRNSAAPDIQQILQRPPYRLCSAEK